MAGEKTYLRVPPDSTGKRVKMLPHAQITYAGLSGHSWVIGGSYTTTFSDTNVYRFTVNSVFESTVTSGILEVTYEHDANYLGVTPSVGANIQYSASTVATVSSVIDVYINATEIVGGDNPENSVHVDNTGSMNIRFPEGLPQLDAFGKLRTSGATILGDYVFAHDTLPTYFRSQQLNGGTVTWDSTKHATLLTNTTTSGAKSTHRSDTYHHYVPGASQLYLGTLALSAGQTNLNRYWGIFDDEDGFMFMLKDSTFGVAYRSKISGSVVNTFIPQSEFNRDTVDGTGPSGFSLDTTKDNIYWIDMQWLGAGRIRFGCYTDEGQRLTMHEVRHANSSSASITTTGALPVAYEQVNSTITYDISAPNKQWSPSGVANATIGSTAEMRAFAAAIYTELNIDIQKVGRSSVTDFQQTIPAGTAKDSLVYVGTLSPKEEITAGNTNRSLYWPSYIDVMAVDASGNDARVVTEVYIEPVLSGTVFSAAEPLEPTNTAEKDTSGTLYGGGLRQLSIFIKGNSRIDLQEENDNMFGGAFKQYCDNGGTKTAALSNISVGNPAVATMALGINTMREGQPLVLDNIVGTMSVYNGDTVYVKLNGLATAELYTDAGLTTGLDTTGLTYTSGGTLSGYLGQRLRFSIVVKPVSPTTGSPAVTTEDIDLRISVGWKEINQ